MKKWEKRVIAAFVGVFAIIILYTVLFKHGMERFENQEVSYIQSLQTVVEAVTTAGFGGFAPWESGVMSLFVIIMNFTGVIIVFLALPAILTPVIQKSIRNQTPTETGLTDHVIICSYSHRSKELARELNEHLIPYVFVDSDEELVQELFNDGESVIHGEVESVETLSAANIEHARALVADCDGETNAEIILAAQQFDDPPQIISVVRDSKTGDYHNFAGSDTVIESRKILGRRLATKAETSFADELRQVIEIDTPINVTELLIDSHSIIAGKTLINTKLFTDPGITVVGMWSGGKFIVSPDPTRVLEQNDILLVIGDKGEISEFQARKVPSYVDAPEEVLVCGYGDLGKTVYENLKGDLFNPISIDISESSGADIIGDITELDEIPDINLSDYRSAVICVDNDSAGVFATLMIKQVAPDVEVIARANEPENVWKLYEAGAEYVVSLPTIAGKIIASEIIGKGNYILSETDYAFGRRTVPEEYTGSTLRNLDLREQEGVTVVCIERNGELLTEITGDTEIERGDTVIISGSTQSVEQFTQTGDGRTVLAE